MGAGPGIVARRLAPYFASITLIEQNPDQIEKNRPHLEKEWASILAVDTAKFVAELSKKQVPFEVVSMMNWWTAKSPEEMYTICRFVVLKNCHTPEQLSKLTTEEALALDRKIRKHAQACPVVDGIYQLEMEDGIVLISPSAA